MVQRQTYTDWELILVDDCSKDHSVDVMKSCIGANSDKIRLIQKEVNEGAAMARNTGIDAARGRYIAFLDADDIWYPGKLERNSLFWKSMMQPLCFPLMNSEMKTASRPEKQSMYQKP